MVRRKRGNTLMIPTLFQSTHPRGVRRNGPRCKVLLQRISIHAPHAGCDIPIFRVAFLITISIHAPHAGCDGIFFSHGENNGNFNPRTPCGVRQCALFPKRLPTSNFNPRTPCGVRPVFINIQNKGIGISIHAPHAGCDRRTSQLCTHYGGFQSTHPMRGATQRSSSNRSQSGDFNPRTPCGVRP